MAMNVGSGGSGDPEVMVDINTTPLIDVMLVLLIMLIITIPIQTHPARAADGVRPEVGKPLQAAQALIKQRRGRDAMAEIAKAEAVPNRTAYENQIIAQMKAAASSSSGDNDATIRNNMAVLESGK